MVNASVVSAPSEARTYFAELKILTIRKLYHRDRDEPLKLSLG
jgi:hypothetical protein